MKLPKDLSDSDRDIIEDEPYNRYVKIIISLVLIIIVGVVGYYLDKTFALSNFVTKITGVQKTSTTQSRGVRFAKIQDVQVGERAIGLYPELDDEDRYLFTPTHDPDPIGWRKLTLEMIKPDGKRLDITLLRPLYWISESKAEIGSTIFLDLPEMGAQGIAKVLNIEPCPPIKPGRGNVITGTFHHEAANTIDVHVEGLSKPIGCTDNHPFWSVTRQEFIEAGKLQPDEQLQLYKGQTAKVIQILPRPRPERVHNLEVMNEHVYRVSEQGVLVHNACEARWFKTDGTIRRYDGNKPTYVIGDHQHAGSRYNDPNKTPIPSDADVVFRRAVPNDPDNPTAWFGQNEQGEIYRFSGTTSEVHFNGIAGVGDGTRNLNQYVLLRLGIERRNWNRYR
jgi:hypothetical protein